MIGEISPVVQTLSQEHFDDYVKRVRIFAHPSVLDSLREIETELPDLLGEAIDQLDE